MKNRISISDGNKIQYFACHDILRLEANGSYTIIYFSSRDPFKCAKLLREIFKMLDAKQFFRIHKTHVVNLNEIKEYEKGRGGKVLLSDGSLICVSYRKKHELLKRLSVK